ncbi:iron-phytosiderophore transporter yellow stripe 1 isoform X2 [Sorghum bicolor]|uniref:iron-phytosiderophore transporter yellow stripe 1 isoform X2 n=1 Tax=Sorghum bicolor TaxID=4558 RepID=UPI000B42686B|nr:iron-phytosiderophore transporter yellow stripe 1 isoform X2 [Sorghum bicolor]|eukprot:XP_021314607.1 iron-phytosiderophore transporter yellow stripe 1 isoform X2 [Sorghum bicolor]
MDRARSGAAAAATDDEEIEKHEPVPEDMESDPAAAREKEQVPPWREQVTLRGMVAALLIGFMYTVIVLKMVLSTGQLPTLNVSAALMAFLALRGWTRVLERLGVAHRPFTRQENCVVETCAVACYTIAFGGGFGSTLLGLDKKTYELAGASPANVPGSYKDPGFGWMAGFVAAISFAGLLSLIPLRKVLVIDYKLTYPSGTATAVLINGFHTKQGDKNAKMQVRGFLKYFGLSFIWSFFQWFYTGGDVCGFVQFPTFGLKAWKQTFFFDFSLTYVGAGMICSHLVNISTLLGAILSWGILWPLISKQKGEWYPANIPESSLKSLYGYKAFLCIALIIGDGMYHFFKVFGVTVKGLHQRLNQKHASNRVANGGDEMVPLDDRQRDEIFNNGSFPAWAAYAGYALLTVISVITIPHIFRQVKWYYIIVAYVLAPLLGFANSYGTGLTDINMAYNYGKIALFIFAAWASKENGVIAGLAGGTLVKQLVIASADLMHDFKTGHLTLTSPRSLLVAQFIGTAMGCVVAPLTFLLFYNAFDIGNPNGYWKAPYGLIYRNMAILGVEGFSVLPKHCLALSAGFFVFAFVFSVARDVLPRKYARFVPLPMAMAVPFLVGGSFAIDMCIGSLIVFVWNKMNMKEAMFMVPAVASGLICGDGIWTFPSSVLALAKIKPPICMKFTPGS